jgi:ribosomal protein L37AE/L43A
MASYRFLTCRKCGWESKSMSYQELTDLGVPWYCDDCGERVTSITTYTDEDLESERLKDYCNETRNKRRISSKSI